MFLFSGQMCPAKTPRSIPRRAQDGRWLGTVWGQGSGGVPLWPHPRQVQRESSGQHGPRWGQVRKCARSFPLRWTQSAAPCGDGRELQTTTLNFNNWFRNGVDFINQFFIVLSSSQLTKIWRWHSWGSESTSWCSLWVLNSKKKNQLCFVNAEWFGHLCLFFPQNECFQMCFFWQLFYVLNHCAQMIVFCLEVN